MDKNVEKFKEYYLQKQVYSTYDKQREGSLYRKKKRQKELNIFLELINKQPKDNILEIGCSSGFLTMHLGKCTAIDTNAAMLKLAKKKNPLAKYFVMDMFKMTFLPNSFDKIVTMRVWTHLNKKNLQRILKKTHKLLKENGSLIFDIEDKNILRQFIRFFYKRLFKITGYKVYQYSYKEIKELLEKNDFEIVEHRVLKHKIGRQIIYKAIKIK